MHTEETYYLVYKTEEQKNKKMKSNMYFCLYI